MRRPDNCLMVIFGASGDLTRRKLMPAVFTLFAQGLLPPGFAVLGLGRTDLDDESFRQRIAAGIRDDAGDGTPDGDQLTSFLELLHYRAMDTDDPQAYDRLGGQLNELDRAVAAGGNRIYYLAVPPVLYEPITTHLGRAGLHHPDGDNERTRLVVEKPFGSDLASARRLNRHLRSVFHEEQIYRIDHYLGKETVQNMLVTRFSNGIYEPLWNRNYVHHVEITAAESVGVEGRGGYYEGAGALRDMIQNHLLQILGLVAMEPPASLAPDAIRNETVKVFDSLRPIEADQVARRAIRGQYVESKVHGEMVPGYRQEPDVAPDSRTETFAAVKLFVDNWRWGGVPFYLRTGKRLPTRVTEVVVHFRPTPHRLFNLQEQICDACNRLVIRIQPDEGILLTFGLKVPGAGFHVRNVGMDFHYTDLSGTRLPSAYERLLLDCMLEDTTLYARGDAVEACWEAVEPILHAWQDDPAIPMHGYPAGSWGPRQADDLIAEPEMTWRYPCKNLSEQGAYCEL